MAHNLRASASFKRAEAAIGTDYDRIVDDAVKLTEIAAPTFEEEARAMAFARMLREAGLSGVRRDAAGNVIGVRRGTGRGPALAVVAHLDTVFGRDVAVKVRRDGNILHAPGIGDDTFALAVLAGYVRALAAAGIRTRSDILFVGSVGEEGLGDLRGIRALIEQGEFAGRIGNVIVMEPAAPGQITATGVGSIRYKATFSGPGGHSFTDFGLVNPAFALGGAMTALGAIKPDPGARTTYNVGTLSGGTSVNAIPYQLSMTVDMRSDDDAALRALDARFGTIVERAVAAENAARSTAKGPITVKLELIGTRPAGRTPLDSALVRYASAALRSGGLIPRFDAQSTDANLPMSKGIPAIVIGHGVHAEKGHSPDEFVVLDRARDIPNMVTALVLILVAADVEIRPK